MSLKDDWKERMSREESRNARWDEDALIEYILISDDVRDSSVKCRVESDERKNEDDRKALIECSNDWKSFHRFAQESRLKKFLKYDNSRWIRD